jgi:hypothetical protein
MMTKKELTLDNRRVCKLPYEECQTACLECKETDKCEQCHCNKCMFKDKALATAREIGLPQSPKGDLDPIKEIVDRGTGSVEGVR